MIIKVKQNQDKGQKVLVNIRTNLSKLSVEEIIEKLNLLDVMLDYHYNVCQEYKNVDDLYSGETLNYLSEILYDAYGNDDFEYDELAKNIMDNLEDRLIEEIYCRDENARAE